MDINSHANGHEECLDTARAEWAALTKEMNFSALTPEQQDDIIRFRQRFSYCGVIDDSTETGFVER